MQYSLITAPEVNLFENSTNFDLHTTTDLELFALVESGGSCVKLVVDLNEFVFFFPCVHLAVDGVKNVSGEE